MAKREYMRYERETVDENGEFKGMYTEASYKIDDGPPFIRLYLNEALKTLYGLPPSCSTLLFNLLRHSNYANDPGGAMTIYVNSSYKKDLIDESEIKNTHTLENSLSLLVKKQILIRVSRGKYQLNPWIFGKGNWTDIHELRMTHIWNRFGHTVEINAKRKKKKRFHMSDEDKEIYNRYSVYEKTAEDLGITLEQFLKQNGLPDPPDWWYLFK